MTGPRYALLTAIYGGYDILHDPVAQQGFDDVDYIAVTDGTVEHDSASRWRPVLTPQRPSPRLAAKRPKFMPWAHTDARYVVWIDGSAHVTSPWFLAECVAALDGAPLAQFVHPDRDCIYPEARLSATISKYDPERVIAQAQHYRATGHPDHWGLWATGVIVYDTHDPRIRRLGDAWLSECTHWSVQDQISQPPLLRRLGLRPATIPGNLWSNRWIDWHPHATP